MPKIIEYFGIILRFFSREHEPIHVHAFFGEECQVKVSFIILEGVIEEIIYENVAGYEPFPPSKIKDLDILIDKYKYTIVNAWIKYFVLNEKIQTITITKKLSKK